MGKIVSHRLFLRMRDGNALDAYPRFLGNLLCPRPETQQVLPILVHLRYVFYL